MDRPTIVIAEDNMLIQEAMRLHVMTDFQVVAAVEDGIAAIDAVNEFQPDVLLLDGGLPSMNGFAVARSVRQSWPDMKIIFVSAQSDQSYVEEAFRAGATGYVLKSRIVSELKPAIRAALAG